MRYFINFSQDVLSVKRLVSLGPTGTSSEYASRYLADNTDELNIDYPLEIALFDTYELARRELYSCNECGLLVANAYRGINKFYMDSKIHPSIVFFCETPEYGIAVNTELKLNAIESIASHPAPIDLINDLFVEDFPAENIIYADSTSHAATLVAKGAVDAALTTKPSAIKHNLSFISSTRTIPMVWTLFTNTFA